jgi:hypothetical protein
VETAALVAAIVSRFERRVSAGDGMTEAERHTNGLVLADLVAASQAIAQAAAFSTGTYPQMLAHVGH